MGGVVAEEWKYLMTLTQEVDGEERSIYNDIYEDFTEDMRQRKTVKTGLKLKCTARIRKVLPHDPW